MSSIGAGLVIPDLWQQEAVRALQQGKDVVVQAPTGSGKTYIFELLYPNLKTQAVFTVPTRALANDKLSEWRVRGWDVGISTGDVALNLDAKVVVATLETQRGRFLRGEGPGLLVMDEFQMLGDPMRGVHYELAVALAPKATQLLFLSGSVANPRDVVAWLERIGRDAVLIEHKTRPVPLEETDLGNLPDSQFVQSRSPSSPRPVFDRTGGSFWPRMIGRAMRADLAPVLVFAPRRAAAEQIAQAIASALPVRDPLRLTPAQEATAGKSLTKLLRNRVAYHHSGLSYAARAGVVESLAKAGQLNVVVATMGLAAGINFSMRSVIVTDRRYFAGNFERQVEADELLQMFGRAGRRGLDEVGHALYTNDLPRLSDTKERQLRRAAQVDWPSLISVMHAAKQRGEQPFAAAVQLTQSLFSVQRVPLGVEHSLETGPRPCGLWVTDERARFVRRGMIEMLNSREEWEAKPAAESVTLGRAFVRETDRWQRALTVPRMLEGIGTGNLCRLREQNHYGRELPVATVLASGEVALVKWLKKELKPGKNAEPRKTLGAGSPTPMNRERAPNSDKSRAGAQRPTKDLAARRGTFTHEQFETEIRPQLVEVVKPGVIVDWIMRGNLLSVRIDYADVPLNAHIDSGGKALIDPPVRENLPDVCRTCDQLEHDKTVAIVNSPTYAWRHLGLIEPDGTPTRRGMIFSFFHGGEGLAVAVALEDESYPIDELVFDLANIRAGPRFAGEDAPMGGRLGILCQRVYRRADYPGYLTMGVPVQYGAGASEVVRALVADPRSKHKLTNELLRHGDIERALVEWRSILRHIVLAPGYPLSRWTELKAAAKELIDKTTSPTSAVDLGALIPLQQRAGAK
jgi:hypothetical protein